MTVLEGERVWLRPVTGCDQDTERVIRWRNSDEARHAFFGKAVVTPDTHAAFVASRRPHEFTWLAEDNHSDGVIGMGALTVDVEACQAEWGKIFVDPAYRKGGYGREIVETVFRWAFDVLNLNRVWVEVYSDNAAIIHLYHKIGLRPCLVPFGHEAQRDRATAFYEMTKAMWQARQ